MRTATVAHAADFSGWRDKARNLLFSGVEPSAINWQVFGAAQDLFANTDSEIEKIVSARQTTFRVPQSFVQLATRVVCLLAVVARTPAMLHTLVLSAVLRRLAS